MNPSKIPPGLAGILLVSALADALKDGPPKCGHEVRADREQERADYLARCMGSIRRQLRNLVNRPERVSERDLLDLAEAIAKDLAHADELTAPPAREQAKQAAAEAVQAHQEDTAQDARAPDPADLPEGLRRGVYQLAHALRELPLPPGTRAELTLTHQA